MSDYDEFILRKVYPIPSTFKVHYPKILIGLLIFIDLSYLFLTIESLITHNFSLVELLVIISILFGLLVFHLDFIHGQLMNKQFVVLSETSIRCKTFFKDIIIEWDKIESTQRYVNRGWVYLDIRGFEKMDELFYKPIFMRIVLDKFKLSEEKLNNTIDKMKTKTQLSKLELTN